MLSYHPVLRPAHLSKRDAAPLYVTGFKALPDIETSRIATGVSRHVWTPAQFREGRRRKDHFICAQWLGLDFDSGEMSLDEAINAFCDVVHIIGTTESHQRPKAELPACDRFRVLLKLARPLTDRTLYEHQLKVLARRYPLDEACLEAARFYFACREIASVNDDGELWDVVEMTEKDRKKTPEARQARRVSGAVIAPWVISLLRGGNWPAGQKNTLCYRIGAELGAHGYAENDIIRLIHTSPEYSTRNITEELAQEIESAVRNGVKRGLADMEKLQG